MVEYPNINGAKKPVAVRVNADGKREYCFGLELWRPTVKKAWQAYEQATEPQKNWTPDKLNAAIAGEFTPDQLEYMRKTGISPERFRRAAELGKRWLLSRKPKEE